MEFVVPISTVVFDVDGTLIDSNGAHAQAYVESLREHGLTVALEEARRVIGMGADKVLPEIAGVSEDSALGQSIVRRKKAFFASLLPDLRATRGARDLVEYLHYQGVSIVVATSAGEEEADALLQQAGIADLFPKRTTKDDAAASKPAPDIVRAALMKAHARPDSSVMIGDTPYDVEAASRSGVGIVSLRCGGHWPDAALRGAVAIFDDPAALLESWRVHPPFTGQRTTALENAPSSTPPAH